MDINDKFNNIVLVLPGGGTKGAYQAGAIKALRQHLDPEYNQVYGVSVGSLNGALVAAQQEQLLEEIWHSLEEGDIFRKRSIPDLIWHLTAWKLGFREPLTAIYDNSPLKKLIRKHLFGMDFRVPLQVGYVNLVNKKYELVSFYTKANDQALQEAVLASTSIPVLFPPVVSARSPSKRVLVDGGLKNISPLGDVLVSDPDLVITIPTEPINKKAGKGKYLTPDIFNISEGSVQTMIDAIFHKDIRSFQRINHMVKEAQKQGARLHKPGTQDPYRYFESLMLAPNKKLGHMLDDNPATFRTRYEYGFNHTYAKIKTFKKEHL